ncbi:hypothetical protein GCM10020370_18440 [Paenibacillus hodogayensis]
MGSIARTGAKRREHAIEINRCDLHRGVGIWSKFNEDFNTPLAFTTMNTIRMRMVFLLYLFR